MVKSDVVFRQPPPRPDSPRPFGAVARASRLAQTRVWGFAAADYRQLNEEVLEEPVLKTSTSTFSLPRRDRRCSEWKPNPSRSSFRRAQSFHQYSRVAGRPQPRRSHTDDFDDLDDGLGAVRVVETPVIPVSSTMAIARIDNLPAVKPNNAVQGAHVEA